MYRKFVFASFFLAPLLQVDAQVITTKNIGPFEVGKSLEEVNEEAGAKIAFSAEDNAKFDFSKTITLTDVDYHLVFQDYYNLNGTYIGKRLYSISVKNDLFKTQEGIGVGSTREDITATYNAADLCIYSNWDEETGKRIPGKTSISVDYVNGDEPGGFLFELTDNKVTEIMINASYQDETKK